MNAIELKNLTLAYRDLTIFRNFTAEIATGEFIGIFGPNGAGKSTLLKAILGILKPVQGEILIFGDTVQRGHTHVGYVPQTRQTLINNQLSGRARLTATLNGFKWGLPLLTKKQRDEINWAIHIVGAENFVDRPFAQLSGGERQRLLLAQALLGHPKILLLDEPLSNLDPRYQEALIELIQHIRTKLNITVLFTSHDVNPLLNIMDKVLYIARGKAVIGPVSEIITSKKLSELYEVDIEVIEYQQRLLVISKELGIDAHADHHHTNH